MKQEISLDDRKVTLVGTAHVSQESKKEVVETIEEVEPDFVGVELDENRLRSLQGDSGWRDVNVGEAIREGKGYFLFLSLLLGIFQRRIGLEEGMKPGEEMLAAVEKSDELGIEYGLIDRDINETFRRAMDELSLWEKVKLVSSLFLVEEEMELEDLKERNMLDAIVEELEESFPSLSKTFIDERDSYMASKILEADFENAVVVVGAAHVRGISKKLRDREKYSEPVPTSSFPWFRAVKYGFPLFVIGMLGYSFWKIGFSTGIEASASWILINGVLATLGAIVARSHPLTWAVAFLVAPLTSLDPALGAGMVAAYAEAKFNPPKVEELESIAYLTEYRDLWSNQVGVILLTFVFVSIGSAAATFIGAGYIASMLGL